MGTEKNESSTTRPASAPATPVTPSINPAASNTPIKPAAPVRRLRLSRQVLLAFSAGMLAMLILLVGIIAAVQPSFLTGTVASSSSVIRYRLFPARMFIPDLSAEGSPYLGEVGIFPNTATLAQQGYMLAEGQKLNINTNQALFSLLTSYGYDTVKMTFNLPDYHSLAAPAKYRYYVSINGLFPVRSDTAAQAVVSDLAYVAEPATYLQNTSDYQEGPFLGEIVLLQAASPSLVASTALPCEGQTINEQDYPALAYVLSRLGLGTTIPDLRGQSPVAGATFYIIHQGVYGFYDIPAGYVRCGNCNSLVPDANFCGQCGSRLR